MAKSFLLTDALHDYLVAHMEPPDEIQRALIDETRALGEASRMQIAPEQGAFMALIARMLGAHEVIEIGTFTGYSSLALARALPPRPSGRLVCLDASEEWTAIARRYWARAGVDDRVELRIGPALESLQAIPKFEQFELAFIDADKANYRSYYEELVPRLRTNGVILADNVLWGGRVADPDNDDENTVALRAFNDHVAADERVESVILPLSDGVTFIRKR